MVYLIDVSGHGIEPALLAVSLQNLLRSGMFDDDTLLDPAALLAQLNRIFQTEQQGDHFFTMWLGIYEKSTRTLRYVSAGAPRPIIFCEEAGKRPAATKLCTSSLPVGVVDDVTFTTCTHSVPPGCRILLYSDGAYELPLRGGKQGSAPEFDSLVSLLAENPGWSLDDLLGELLQLTEDGVFEDDVSLICLDFD
jgi:serine phosphatase RsbU (regulator of sigma subunit)